MNYIDLTCPAEIFRTALPTQEIPAATLTLYNLSDRVISSVEVSLRLLDADGEETERLAFRGRALNGRPRSTFLLTAPCAPSPDLRSIEATIVKVWFADNDTWRRNPLNAVPYTPNNLAVSPALTRLKYAAGETAVGYPSLQDGLWVCICGRPNPLDEPCCVRCGQMKDTVFTRFTREAVEAQVTLKQRQLDLSSRNMREDTIRLQRLREEEYKKKKARRRSRLRTLIAIPAALGLTAAALFWASPWLRLTMGRHSLETGDAAGAKAAFEALGDFGNAKELLAESEWQLALAAAEDTGSAESMEKAAALLRQVEGKPEAIAKANELDLLRSRWLLADGDWEQALAVLANVPEETEGREDLEKDCLMAKGYSLQKELKYAEAKEIFLSLGSYPGAWEQAAACVYAPAKSLMMEGDWDGAIETLSQIPDYLDSRSLTLECHYRKAVELKEEGNRDAASREFLLAGEWGDAPAQYRQLTFEQAEELYADGDLKAAQALYASLPDDPDAAEKEKACRYELARMAAADLEYTVALEYLQGIEDEYKETRDLRAEASYQKAKIAIRQEDWETAARLLGSIDREAILKRHRDAETLYLEACEKAGIEPYPATPEPAETEIPATETPAPAAPEASGAPESEAPAETSPLEAFMVEDEDEQP